MRHSRYAVSAAFFLLALLPVASQTPAPEATTVVADELRAIRQALDRLVQLHEIVGHRQEIDLLMKRIDIQERRLEPLERELSRERSAVKNTQEHLTSLEAMLEQHEQLLDEEIRDGVDAPRSETRRMIDDIERTLSTQSERLKAERFSAQQIEDELAQHREDVEILDDLLMEMIETEQRRRSGR